MNVTFFAAGLERFRAAIAGHLGLAFDDRRLAELGEVFRRRLAAMHETSFEYLPGLERRRSLEERRALAAELTIHETYFRRHFDQLRAFAEVALPRVIAGNRRPISISCAGCTSGEEPYTPAMLVRDRFDRDAAIRARAAATRSPRSGPRPPRSARPGCDGSLRSEAPAARRLRALGLALDEHDQRGGRARDRRRRRWSPA